MSQQNFKAGVDLTTPGAISKSDVQQAIELAYPYPGRGLFIFAVVAPDVVANPELARFIWVQVNANGTVRVDAKNNPYIFYYQAPAWEQIPFGVLPGSIELTDLDLAGSAPYFIIQVNQVGNALIWIDIKDAIQAASLNINKLIGVNDGNNYVLMSLSGARTWESMTAFVSQFLDHSIPLAKIAAGAANTFLRMLPDGATLAWTTADISDLLAAGAQAGQSPRRNTGNTGWSFANLGTTYIAPTVIANYAAITGWTTYDISAHIAAADLLAVKGVLLHIDALISTSGGAQDSVIQVQGRPSAAGNTYELAKARGVFGAGVAPCIGQFQVPTLNTAGVVKVDLQLASLQASGGVDNITVSVKMIGYII